MALRLLEGILQQYPVDAYELGDDAEGASHEGRDHQDATNYQRLQVPGRVTVR